MFSGYSWTCSVLAHVGLRCQSNSGPRNLQLAWLVWLSSTSAQTLREVLIFPTRNRTHVERQTQYGLHTYVILCRLIHCWYFGEVTHVTQSLSLFCFCTTYILAKPRKHLAGPFQKTATNGIVRKIFWGFGQWPLWFQVIPLNPTIMARSLLLPWLGMSWPFHKSRAQMMSWHSKWHSSEHRGAWIGDCLCERRLLVDLVWIVRGLQMVFSVLGRLS